MKREKLIEWYGRRLATNSRIAAFILIIAFGIFMAYAEPVQESVKHEPEIEHLLNEPASRIDTILFCTI